MVDIGQSPTMLFNCANNSDDVTTSTPTQYFEEVNPLMPEDEYT